MAYATAADLTAWLGEGLPAPAQPEADRMLERAVAVVDAMVTYPYATDSAGDATDTDVIAALRDASCAQVEYWLEVGEDVDVVQYSGSFSAGGASIQQAPGPYSPRALRALQQAGLRRGPRIA